MRILIDESLPIAFAAEISGHDVKTVRAQRWLGLRNGVLLRAAVDAGFEVMITADKAPSSAEPVRIGIAVVLITHVRNRMQDLRPLVPRVVEVLRTVRKGELVEVTG